VPAAATGGDILPFELSGNLIAAMPSILPIAVADLLHQRAVEGVRIEFKAAWNDGPTADQVLKTIAAFANDYQEVGGGYLVLGVGAEQGRAALPPRGIPPEELEAVQQRIRVLCRRLEPEYQPLQSAEIVDGRHILVLWCPASFDRPHFAPASREDRERKLFIRLGAETVEARGEQRAECLRRSTHVPFDDRPARGFTLDDLRSTLVREFLRETGSGLLAESEDLRIWQGLQLTARTNGHEVPRNVALMFFSHDPERAFRGARIEVVQFSEGGDVLDEQIFRGPLDHQIRTCLAFLDGVITRHIRKVPEQAEARTWKSYPLAAVEEALANALHHRSYEPANPEPVTVYLYPDRMTINSHPGPVPGLEAEHFAPGVPLPPIPRRNRRVGELLKDLRLAEVRGSGVGKIYRAMEQNGSPPPRFEFGAERSYFSVVLPIHEKSRPAPRAGATGPTAAARRAGLILVAVGSGSIRPVVEASLGELGLAGAEVLVDEALPDYLEADSEHFEAEARRLRNALRTKMETPDIEALHLFYRGPVAMGPLLGAVLAASSRPVSVYHHQSGRYVLVYTMDRRFLTAKDSR